MLSVNDSASVWNVMVKLQSIIDFFMYNVQLTKSSKKIGFLKCTLYLWNLDATYFNKMRQGTGKMLILQQQQQGFQVTCSSLPGINPRLRFDNMTSTTPLMAVSNNIFTIDIFSTLLHWFPVIYFFSVETDNNDSEDMQHRNLSKA